ncbi:MAG TPA: hypothetical protein VFT12_09565, partial [Thermoanaerobaculia bacterium]|nr:hypothetical protein [Thermoanaerobaculia bacterium]
MPPLTADCGERGEGDPNNRNPVVCVSVYGEPRGFGGLLVNPMVVHATRREPVVLKWQTRNLSEDIEVRMKDENCTAQNACRGRGTCTIPIKPNPAGGEVCRYE